MDTILKLVKIEKRSSQSQKFHLFIRLNYVWPEKTQPKFYADTPYEAVSSGASLNS